MLLSAYPNPFKTTTTVSYDLPLDGYIQIDLFNNLGQRVQTLYTGFQRSGTHNTFWDGRDRDGKLAPSGIYLLRLKSEGVSKTAKILLLH